MDSSMDWAPLWCQRLKGEQYTVSIHSFIRSFIVDITLTVITDHLLCSGHSAKALCTSDLISSSPWPYEMALIFIPFLQKENMCLMKINLSKVPSSASGKTGTQIQVRVTPEKCPRGWPFLTEGAGCCSSKSVAAGLFLWLMI